MDAVHQSLLESIPLASMTVYSAGSSWVHLLLHVSVFLVIFFNIGLLLFRILLSFYLNYWASIAMSSISSGYKWYLSLEPQIVFQLFSPLGRSKALKETSHSKDWVIKLILFSWKHIPSFVFSNIHQGLQARNLVVILISLLSIFTPTIPSNQKLGSFNSTS